MHINPSIEILLNSIAQHHILALDLLIEFVCELEVLLWGSRIAVDLILGRDSGGASWVEANDVEEWCGDVAGGIRIVPGKRGVAEEFKVLWLNVVFVRSIVFHASLLRLHNILVEVGDFADRWVAGFAVVALDAPC